MITAPLAVTNPDAGVMTTSPATAPEQNPRTVGLPRVNHSIPGPNHRGDRGGKRRGHERTSRILSAATALPALNPYQPTQSMPVPITGENQAMRVERL